MIFQSVQFSSARLKIDVFNRFALLQKHSVDANVRFDLHQLPVYEMSFANSLTVGVTKDDVFEVGFGV